MFGDLRYVYNHGVPHLDGKQHQLETSAVMYYVILTVVLSLLLYGCKKKKSNIFLTMEAVVFKQ